MWTVLSSIVMGFISGPLKSISNDLKQAYQAKLNAANDAERLAVDERINILEARKSIILASQEHPIGRWVRALFAIPCIVYTWKLIIYDKVFALGATDTLSPELWQLFWIIVGGFFIDSTIKGTARIIKR